MTGLGAGARVSVHFQPVAILVQERLANALDLQQLIHRGERAIAVTLRNNSLGFGLADPGEVALQGGHIGFVQIDLGRHF